MKVKSLKLTDLKVQSFILDLGTSHQRIKGGAVNTRHEGKCPGSCPNEAC